MNRGSNYWQERWEFVTKNRETELGINLTKASKCENTERYYIDRSVLAKDENKLARAQRFSVTKLAFLVWDIICISAFFLWLTDIFKIISFRNMNMKFTLQIWGFHLAIIAYISFFWKKGYVYENITKTTKGVNDNHRGNKYSSERDVYIENKIVSIEK